MEVAVQLPPLPCRPQEPATQVAGAVQSALVVQVLTQAVLEHRPGAQFMTAGVTHAPAPLH